MQLNVPADRSEFAPPPQRGTPRAVILALIAHAVLIAALTWGVRWKRDAENDAVEAELWSTTVQQAAPRAALPPPAPVPRPVPTPPPPPPPPPPPQAVQPPPPAPVPKQPDINLEREKKLKEQKEQREREEDQRERAEKKKQEAAQKAALDKKKELEAKKREDEKEEAERKKEQQQKLAEQQKKKQEADAKKAEAAKAEAASKQAAAAQSAKERDANLKRMQAMAGTGGETSTGTAARSSGPSGGYGGKVAAVVRPNVVFPDADMVNGNPAAEFDIRLAPDGTIVGKPELVKSSGLPGWDEAALRALQKTEKLPRDVDGTVPARLIVSLRPKR